MATTTSILTLPSFHTTTSGSFRGTGCDSVNCGFVYHLHRWRHRSVALPLPSRFSFLKCLPISFYSMLFYACFMAVRHRPKPVPEWMVTVKKYTDSVQRSASNNCSRERVYRQVHMFCWCALKKIFCFNRSRSFIFLPFCIYRQNSRLRSIWEGGGSHGVWDVQGRYSDDGGSQNAKT